MKSAVRARALLLSQPSLYKRCIISLDGPFSAKCKLLDLEIPLSHLEKKGSTLEDLEVRGLREVIVLFFLNTVENKQIFGVSQVHI